MASSSRADAAAAAQGLLREYANAIQGDIVRAAGLARQLATTAEALAASKAKSRDDLGHVVTGLVRDNPDLLGITLVFEPNALDGRDADFVGHPYAEANSGRFATYVYRDDKHDIAVEKLDMTDAAAQVWYMWGRATQAGRC